MAMFLWNWIRCILRTPGSSTFQYECPARVVGISEPARIRADRRNPLADRRQQRGGLIDTPARRAQRVGAEQDVRGSGEDAGGRAQRRQHAPGHGHNRLDAIGEPSVSRTVRGGAMTRSKGCIPSANLVNP